MVIVISLGSDLWLCRTIIPSLEQPVNIVISMLMLAFSS